MDNRDCLTLSRSTLKKISQFDRDEEVQVPIPMGFVDGSLYIYSDAVEEWENPEPRAGLEIVSSKQKVHGVSRTNVEERQSKEVRGQDIRNASRSAVDLQEAIASGWKVSSIDKNGASVLHWAAGSGRMEVIYLLLDVYSLPVDQCTRAGMTPLHWAARNGQTDVCGQLIDKYGANRHHITRDGVNAFHWAVFSGSVSTCEALVVRGIDHAALNRWGCGAIHWAAASGSQDMCEWLGLTLNHSFNLNNSQGHNGLMKAGWNGHLNLCQWLVDGYAHAKNAQCSVHGELHADEKQLKWTNKKMRGHLGPILLASRDRAGMNSAEISLLNGHKDVARWISHAIEVHSSVGAISTCIEFSELRNTFLGKWLCEATETDQLRSQKFTMFYRNQKSFIKDDTERDEQALSLQWKIFEMILRSPAPSIFRVRHYHITKWLESLPNAFYRMSVGDSAGISIWAANPKALKYHDTRARMLAAKKCFDIANVTMSSSLSCIALYSSVRNKLRANCSMGLVLGASPYEQSYLLSDLMRAAQDNGALIANGYNRQFVADSKILRNCDNVVLSLGSSFKFPNIYKALQGGMRHFTFVMVIPECSHDGALRDKPSLWQTWAKEDAFKHHSSALKTLMRGLHLLHPEGYLAYYVDSFNPIEAESVVAAAIRRFKGRVRVANVRPFLPERLPVRSGMTSWLVPSPGESLFRFLRTWNKTPEDLRVPLGPLRASMFDPTSDAKESDVQVEENWEKIGLDGVPSKWIAAQLYECVRLMPSVEFGMGGGFLALLEKSACAQEFRSEMGGEHTEVHVLQSKISRSFLPVQNEDMIDIVSFFGIRNDLFCNNVLVLECNTRDAETVRSISLMPKRCQILMEELARATKKNIGTELFGAGVSVLKPMPKGLLTEQDMRCRWIPVNDGVSILWAFSNDRKLLLSQRDYDQVCADRRLRLIDIDGVGRNDDDADVELAAWDYVQGMIGGGGVGGILLRNDGDNTSCIAAILSPRFILLL